MAGIGFALRKLASKDDFQGIMRAYFHAAVAAVGPWILLVVSLGLISFFTSDIAGRVEVNEFFSVVVYNILFSFVLSAPLYQIASRYVSDCLFSRDATPIPGILLTSLFYVLIPALSLAIPFYVFYATMTPFATILSIVNFTLLCMIWFVMLYLSCIRNFRAITIAWVVGMLLASVVGIYLGKKEGTTGMLLGLNIGLIALLFSLIANILAEYPYRFLKPKEYGFYFRHYKLLFWSGLFLFAGMWVDKIIMWFSSNGITHLNNLRTYPIYDGAMFASYLSIIPVMALFIFSLETNFYDFYIQYIRNIETNAPFDHIEAEKKNLMTSLIENGRNMLILQGCFTFVVIALAPTLFEWLKMDFLQLGIFRLGTLGAFFTAINLFIVILFSYFDSQENMLIITIFMFVSNIVLTLVSLKFGFIFYGYGFCLSMILTTLIGSVLFFRFMGDLTYNIFITHVVKRHDVTQKPEGRSKYEWTDEAEL